jgi:hypothetical protein
MRPPAVLWLPALAACLYGWAVFATTFTHPGAIGLNYIAPGTDWMVLYAAIRLALTGGFALTLDGAAFTAHLNTTFAAWLPEPLFYRPWVYPPSFLVLLYPFAGLGFLGSYLAFQLTTAALMTAALLHRATNRRAATWIALAALACPAASINVVDGQCGFLVAALLVLGIRLLGPHSLLAGAVLGLLSVKPQFGLLIPFALLARRDTAAILGATASTLALIALSIAAFGLTPWTDWFSQTLHSFSAPDSAWLTFGRLWGNSVYACAALLGLPPWLASTLQATALLAAAAATYTAFRPAPPTDRPLALLLAATILAAPHSSTYDAVLLTVAAGLWLAIRPIPNLGPWIMALCLLVSPLIGPPMLSPIGRAVPILVAGFIAILLRQTKQEKQALLF